MHSTGAAAVRSLSLEGGRRSARPEKGPRRARTRPSHEEVNKTRFQFAFSPYFASEVATYVPDGIACSKWTETSGFMCAGCAHVRPRGSLSICFFLMGNKCL